MEEVYKVKLVPTNCIGDKAYSDKTKEYIELKDGEILAKRTDIDYLFKNFKVESVEYLGNLGRFAKGLYKEKNFWKNSSVSEKDVSKSLQVLNKNRISEKEESIQETDCL